MKRSSLKVEEYISQGVRLLAELCAPIFELKAHGGARRDLREHAQRRGLAEKTVVQTMREISRRLGVQGAALS